jgi:hypothetical protein
MLGQIHLVSSRHGSWRSAAGKYLADLLFQSSTTPLGLGPLRFGKPLWREAKPSTPERRFQPCACVTPPLSRFSKLHLVLLLPLTQFSFIFGSFLSKPFQEHQTDRCDINDLLHDLHDDATQLLIVNGTHYRKDL